MSRVRQKRTGLLSCIAVLAVLLLLAASACTSGSSAQNGQVCNVILPEEPQAPTLSEVESSLYIFEPDRSRSYFGLLQHALDGIVGFFKEALQPGDHVIIHAIASDSSGHEETIFNDFIPIVPPPTLPPRPLIPEKPASQVGCPEYADAVMQHKTDIETWSKQVNGLFNKWSDEQAEATATKLEELSQALLAHSWSPDNVATDINGALYWASRVADRELASGSVADVDLILATDGIDTAGNNVSYSLAGVDVTFAFYERLTVEEEGNGKPTDELTGENEWRARLLHEVNADTAWFINVDASSVPGLIQAVKGQ